MTPGVVFMGSPAFGVPTLRALHDRFPVIGVVTQKDRPKGRGLKTGPTPVKKAAEELGIPVIEPDRLLDQATLATLRDWNPDVIVVAAYGKILPEQILELPRFGCVNLHASLLPRHRGASPISAAILAGDTVSGLCTMLMDRGLDTGDVLLCVEVPVDDDDTAGSLHDKLMEPGARLVVKTLELMMENNIQPLAQDDSRATYTKLLSKKDGRMDWRLDAQYLCRLVRSLNPAPGAFFELAGEKIKVWQATSEAGLGHPGEISTIGHDGILVGTGHGLLLLKQLQAPSRGRVAGWEFAQTRRLRAGDRLAPPFKAGESDIP